MRRYARPVILAFLIVFLTIPAVWILGRPEYTATGQIRVKPVIPYLVFRTEDSGTIPSYQSYLNTQVALVLRPEVLNRVLDKEEVKSTQWYRRESHHGVTDPDPSGTRRDDGLFPTLLGGPRSHVERLRDDLSVRPRADSEIIDVAMTTCVGSDAAVIVNAVLDQYLVYTTETSDSTNYVLFQELVKEYEKLRSELNGHENIIATLRERLETNEPDQLITQMRVRLDEAEARLESLRRQINAAEWEEQEAWRQILQDPAVARLLYPRLSGAINVLKAEIQALEPSAAAKPEQPPQAATEVTPAPEQPPGPSPEQVALADTPARLTSLRQELAVVERQAKELSVLLKPEAKPDDGPSVTASSDRPSHEEEPEVIARLRNAHCQAQQLTLEERLLAMNVEQERKGFKQAFEQAQTLARETEAIRYKRELYEAVRMRLAQKEMERNVPGPIEVTKAFVPSEPSRDRRLLFTGAALVTAVCAGFVYAFRR